MHSFANFGCGLVCAICKCVQCALAFLFSFFGKHFIHCSLVSALQVTVSIWGVGHFETPNFQFTIPFDYIHYNQFNYLLPNDLYALLGTGIPCYQSFYLSNLLQFSFFPCVDKTYSFAILGQALARVNCKCVWLMRWHFLFLILRYNQIVF